MYEFNLPVKIIFGTNSLKQLEDEAAGAGNSALIVTGKTSMQKTGILLRVEKILQNKGLNHLVWNKVPPEPTTEIVDEGIRFAKKLRPALVIGLGGGSAIDVAKATAGLVNEKDFVSSAEYLEGEGTKKISSRGIPFIAIPTTAGTGSEVTRNSVLINPRTRRKRSIRSDLLFARTAIVDPQLTLPLPPQVTAFSGMDALVHLIEGYISKKATPFTDCIALSGIKLVGEGLINAVRNGNDLGAREKMSLAALFGGIVLTNAGLGVDHGIASFLGGLYGISHGLACAILLPYVLEFNLPVRAEKTRQIARVLGGKEASDAVKIVKEINKKIGIPARLSGIGIKQEGLAELVRLSLTASSTRGNPREVTYADLLELLKKLL